MKPAFRSRHLPFHTVLALVAGIVLAGCGGGTKVLKEPQKIETTHPLAQAESADISVELTWIIVSNGPGSWARNAYWDEYLVNVHNPSAQALSITGVAVYDSRGQRNLPLANRKKLVKGTRKTISRYKESDIDVSPGMGAGQLLATGGVVTVTGVGLAYAAASTVAPVAGGASAGASMVAVAGNGMVVAGPIVAVVAIKQATDNSEISDEIRQRRTKLPVEIAAGESATLHLFYPIVVSPTHMVVSYAIGETPQQLTVDTAATLAGLHLGPPGGGADGGEAHAPHGRP